MLVGGRLRRERSDAEFLMDEEDGGMVGDFERAKFKEEDLNSKHSGSRCTYKDRPQPTKWKPSEEQKKWLNNEFQGNPYPNMETKSRLAENLCVKRSQISKWFQHKRESMSKLGRFHGQKQRERRTAEEVAVLEG